MSDAIAATQPRVEGFVHYRVTAGGLLQRVQASTDPAELEAVAEASGASLSDSLLVQPRPRSPPIASSCLTATASLTLACAGAGILSFPWALSVSRLPAFALTGALVLALSALGMLALSARADGADAWCYERVMGRAFGPRAEMATTLCIVVQQVGSLVGFLVAIFDFLVALAPKALSPAALLVVLAGVVLWPLSLLPMLQSLWLPNALSIAAICAVAGVVVSRAAQPGSTCPAAPGHH